MDAEFGHEVGAMDLDRSGRDAEVVGDSLVRVALGETFKNIPFTLRQQINQPPRSGFFDGTAICPINARESAVDRIEQATSKPRWYTPMISSDGLLMSVLLPQAQDSREAARMLATLLIHGAWGTGAGVVLGLLTGRNTVARA